MRTGTAFSAGVALTTLLCGAASGQSVDGRADVVDFVLAIHAEGIPYSVAREYTPEDSEILLGMLQTNEHMQYWPNITKVVGIIAADAAVEPLITFVRGADDHEWSTAAYRGRASAISALGYHAYRSGNAYAMRYLLSSVDPQAWSDLPWLRAREDAERLAINLSTSAVLGLALTGRIEAGRRLYELADEGSHPRIQRMAQSVLPDFEEIRDHGMTAYENASQETSARR